MYTMAMNSDETKIELYDKRQASTTTLYVIALGHNKFRMTDNEVFNCNLTFGTEFETRINEVGKHEIIRISKKSEYVARRFFLSPKFKESDYRLLGEELSKRGGFWQVDFGSVAIVNIPKDFEFDVDEVMKELGMNLTEIVDDINEKIA